MRADRKRRMMEAYFGDEAAGKHTTGWRPFFLRHSSDGTLNIMASFTDALIDEGDFSRAFNIQERVFEAVRQKYGAEHIRTIDAAEKLAIILDRLHRVEEAIALERSVLSDRIKVLGGEHEHTILAMARLGTMHKGNGDLIEAEALLRSATEITGRVEGLSGASMSQMLCELANILDDQRNFDEARSVAESAVQLSDSEDKRIDSLQVLAMILRRQRELDKAAELQREVLAYRTETAGANNRRTITSLILLSNILYLRGDSGDLSEARLLALQAQRSAEALAGEDDQQATTARELVQAIEIKEKD